MSAADLRMRFHLNPKEFSAGSDGGGAPFLPTPFSLLPLPLGKSSISFTVDVFYFVHFYT